MNNKFTQKMMNYGIIFFIMISNTVLLVAQDVKITGQVRHRSERNDKDFTESTSSYGVSFLRSRLNLKFDKENSYAFVQVQDARIFGSETNTLGDGSADAIDYHQAYFNVSDVFTKGLSIKIGRQEVAYANQRLMGSVGWHNIGRSFDGFTANYKREKYNANFFSLIETESNALGDVGDKNVRGVWVETSFVNSTRVDLFFINQNTSPGDVLNRHTYGVFSKGSYSLGSMTLSQETDFALQSGLNEGNDVAASLFGTRVKLKPNNSAQKIWVGVGYDVVSGDDVSTSDDEAFNTLYATNHKYYGFMDYFLNVPVHTQGAGLTDVVFSGGFKPKAKWSVKADYHILTSSQEMNGLSAIGTELDLTAVYGYSKDIKVITGASFFTPDELFNSWRGDANASWGYIMTVYNF